MDLLWEVGCEEIPARFIPTAVADLKSGFLDQLEKQRLNPEQQVLVQVRATPRRLVLQASGLAERQADLEEEVLGPKVEAAYDAEGRATRACQGFAKSKGIDPEQLEIFDTAKGKVVGLHRQIAGEPSEKILAALLPELIAGLHFPKTMRWGQGETAFARPVHWILALLDGKVLAHEFAGIRASNYSRGHRFVTREPFLVESSDSFESQLAAHGVILDPEKRRSQLMEQARCLAKEAGGRLVEDEALTEEVSYLTEQPLPLLGRFEPKFLALPREVLVTAMRKHQRYFSVENAEGGLLNAFVAIGNTPVPDQKIVCRGYERVLTARLNDAEFFYTVDQKVLPAARVDDLGDMIFQAALGSYLEKTNRNVRLAAWLADRLCPTGSDVATFRKVVERAGLLAKTDLLTEMVGEFPELQGLMGGVYAALAGEDPAVALAIGQQYHPRFAGDRIAESHEGAMISLADRMDTLAGCFGVGLRPTGKADPYALRRQCLGVVAIVLGKDIHVSLREMIAQAVAGVYDKVESALLKKAKDKERKRAARKKQRPTEIVAIDPFEQTLVGDILEFFYGRLKQRLAEHASVDVVEAVLAAGMDDMVDTVARSEALVGFMGQAAFSDLAIAFKRVANIIKDFEGTKVDPELFQQPEEEHLHQVYLDVAPKFEDLLGARNFAGGLELLAGSLRGPVDQFFDKVLVNDPQDLARQNNRKALLFEIENMFGRIADFTRLQLKGPN